MKKTEYFLISASILFIVIDIIISIIVIHQLNKNTIQLSNQEIATLGNHITGELEDFSYNLKKEALPFSKADLEANSLPKFQIKDLEIFYSKYQNLISSLSILDKDNNAFNISRDKNKNFIEDNFISRNGIGTATRDTFYFNKGEYIYTLPLMAGDKICGNLSVTLCPDTYFNNLFTGYYIKNKQWQWVINKNGQFISGNLEGKSIEIEGLKKILQDISSSSDIKTIRHTISIEKRDYHCISVYYPIKCFNQTVGLIFSQKNSYFSGLQMLWLFFGLLVFLSLSLLFIYKKRNKPYFTNVQLQNIVESIPFAAMLLDSRKKIKIMNEKAVRLFMVPNQQTLRGKDLSAAFKNISECPGFEKRLNNQVFSFLDHDKEIVVLKKENILPVNDENLSLKIFVNLTSVLNSFSGNKVNFLNTDLLEKINQEISTNSDGIVGMSDILLHSSLNTEQQAALEEIRKSASFLSVTVKDILDFLNLVAGKISLEETSFNLQNVVSTAITQFQPFIQKRDLKLDYEISEDIPDRIIGDPLRLKQILTYLIDNAIKFTTKGRIEIQANLAKQTENNLILEFSVSDNGKGMSQEQVDAIFGAGIGSAKVVNSRIKDKGTGIYIVKRLVQMMGGELIAQSPSFPDNRRDEQGLSVTFTLSAFADNKLEKNIDFSEIEDFDELQTLVVSNDNKNEDLLLDALDNLGVDIELCSKPEQSIKMILNSKNSKLPAYHLVILYDTASCDGFKIAKELHEKNISEKIILWIVSLNHKAGNFIKSRKLGVDTYINKPLDPSGIEKLLLALCPNVKISYNAKEIKKGKTINILVAEDNVINQQVAKSIFNSLGYPVTIVRNGDELITKSKSADFDIIFMNLMMPGKDGFQATKELRKMGMKSPIIAMTAQANPEDQKAAFAAGINDFINKPVKNEVILSLMDKYFPKS